MTYYAIKSAAPGSSFNRGGMTFRGDAWTLVNAPSAAILNETRLLHLAVTDLTELGLGGTPITNPSLLSGDPNDALKLSDLDGLAVGLSRPVSLRTVRNLLMSQVNDTATEKLLKTVKVALAALDTAGGVLAWQNPESGSIIIESVDFDVTTIATGACSLDVGTTTVSAATKSDNMIDGLDVHTATGTFTTADQAGANGKRRQKLAASKWLTASTDSGAAAGLIGFAYINYFVA
jgi:hypothetical protein